MDFNLPYKDKHGLLEHIWIGHYPSDPGSTRSKGEHFLRSSCSFYINGE